MSGGKRIACFSIPAHGHTNPMIRVAAELVKRGNTVRFYSFQAFEERIRAAGAAFVACDAYMPALTQREEAGLKRVSTTEMTIQDIRLTLAMDDFLEREFREFRPDVVYTDAVCFWGKLNAWKHGIPMVVSTSTFAFNQLSSGYMKHRPAEMADMILGLPRIGKALKELEPYGYHVSNPLTLVQNDNATDSVVYTSRRFQPYAESFSDHYRFVGPSLPTEDRPHKDSERPLVYIALGTVINDRPDFYRRCMEALKDLNAEVIISCGEAVDPAQLGPLPDNVRVFPRVDQPEVLARASAFLTHCGMNSVSESLYMATPMVLYPQTGEQQAVARRVREIGAGILLREDSPEGIRGAVEALLNEPGYREAAENCSRDFRSCGGPAEAAEFIETAPHPDSGPDPVAALNRRNGKFQRFFWLAFAVGVVLTGVLAGWQHCWLFGLPASLLNAPLGKALAERNYRKLAAEKNALDGQRRKD